MNYSPKVRGFFLSLKNLYPYVVITGVYLASLFIISPFKEVLLDDSWSYALTVRHLLEDGRMLFPATVQSLPFLHVLWGFLWVKILGYHLGTLTFANFLTAAAVSLMFYECLKKAGFNTSVSLLATLTLSLNPIFFVLAYTFQADLNFTFFLLFAFWALLGFLNSGGFSHLLLLTLATAILPWTRTFGILALPAAVLTILLARPQRPLPLWHWLFFLAVSLGSFYLSWRLRPIFQPQVIDFVYSSSLFWRNLFDAKLLLYLPTKLFLALGFFGLSLLPLFLGYIKKLKGFFTKKYALGIWVGVFLLLLFIYLADRTGVSLGGMMNTPPSFLNLLTGGHPNAAQNIKILLLALKVLCFIPLFLATLRLAASWTREGIRLPATIFLFSFLLVLIPFSRFFDRYLIPLLPLVIMLILDLWREVKLKPILLIAGLALLAAVSLARTHQYLESNLALWKTGNQIAQELHLPHAVHAGYAFTCYYSHEYYFSRGKDQAPFRLLADDVTMDYCPGMRPKFLLHFYPLPPRPELALMNIVKSPLFNGLFYNEVFVYRIITADERP